ncbi:hypothetical protein HPB48_006297 [Haemaphysalis longicornis]|uniref:Peptidase M13 C-terminal domain-containing protein n=1 Tax=Haemaphysalis longicornis TaxID=44386 RepID=A0A9J6GQ16_HAELO|nr:hypothetical protein HPB48_006297 [Haemaphysalis longicornis]
MQPLAVESDEALLRELRLRRRNRILLRRFLDLSGVVAAGVTTVGAAGILVYFGLRSSLDPVLVDGGLRGSASCAVESARIGQLLASREADACQDFYAAVCDLGRGPSPVELEMGQKLMCVGTTKQTQKHPPRWRKATGVAAVASVLYFSCLSLMRSRTLPVEENMKAISAALKLNLETAFGKLDTPLAILKALSFLSNEGGLPSFVSLCRDTTGTLLLSVRRLLSVFLDDNTMADVFYAVSSALNVIDDDMGRRVRDLLETDRDLKRNWDLSSSVETVSLEELTGLRANLTEEDWSKLSLDVPTAPSSQTPSTVSVKGLSNVKLALTALFARMDQTSVAIYLLSHVLLPEEMLAVLARKEFTSCLRLVRFVFEDGWYAVAREPTPAEAAEASQELAIVAKAVGIVLKKHISQSPLSVDPDDLAEAVDKITHLIVSTPNATVVPYKAVSTMSARLRARLDKENLYKNLLEFRRYHAAAPSKPGPVFDEFGDPTLLFEGDADSSGRILMTRSALAPPFTCGDHFLNYAGLGAVVAQALLEAVGGPFCVGRRHGLGECGRNSSAATTRLDMVKTCLATNIKAINSSPSLESGVQDSELPLDSLAVSTAAFQVALEAGHENYSVHKKEEEPAFGVPAEVDMKFLIRYCYRLCERQLDENFSRSNPSLSARLQCNVAVMNTPMFAELFNCSQGDPMYATERCAVL